MRGWPALRRGVKAASGAFILLVTKPPKVSVFGVVSVTILQMIKSCFVLIIIGIVPITLLTYSLVVPRFDIVFGQVPGWTGCGAG